MYVQILKMGNHYLIHVLFNNNCKWIKGYNVLFLLISYMHTFNEQGILVVIFWLFFFLIMLLKYTQVF